MAAERKRPDQQFFSQEDPRRLDQTKKRRQLTLVACDACRSRKAACDGQRPACGRCAARGVLCNYVTDNGRETRFEALKRQNEELRERIRVLESESAAATSSRGDGAVARPDPSPDAPATRHFPTLATSRSLCSDPAPGPNADDGAISFELIRAMCKSSDSESTLILARLRTGERPKDILRFPMHPDDIRNMVTDVAPQEFPSKVHEPQNGEEVSHHTHLLAYFDRKIWANSSAIQTPRIEDGERDTWQRENLVVAPGLWNRFGNLSFEGAIAANHMSAATQEVQQRNFHLPRWAVRTLNDSTNNLDPYEAVIAELNEDLRRGIDPVTICGPHAYVAALRDPDTFARAPKLSRATAMIVQGIKSGETHSTLTPFALMWLHWSLLRWMLMPTQQSYSEIPRILRPLSCQLFRMHSRVVDFVFPRILREHVVQQAYHDLRWITEGCKTIRCEWPVALEEAFYRHPISGELDLSNNCKIHASNETSWSLGPSVRPYLLNVDQFVNIT